MNGIHLRRQRLTGITPRQAMFVSTQRPVSEPRRRDLPMTVQLFVEHRAQPRARPAA